MGNLKIPFAIKNNRMICISDLSIQDRGLKCNCCCPSCKAPLIAKLGPDKQHHFSHSSNSCDEEKAYILSIYMVVKEIMDDRKEILLPGLKVCFNYHSYSITRYNIHGHIKIAEINEDTYGFKNFKLVFSRKKVIIEHSVIDYDRNGKIAALEVYSAGRCFAISIALPSTVCKNYNLKKHKDMATLTLDLRDKLLDITSLSKKNMEKIVIDELTHKSWLSNSKVDKILDEIITENDKYIIDCKSKEEKERTSVLSKIITDIPVIAEPMSQKTQGLSIKKHNDQDAYIKGFEEISKSFDMNSEEWFVDSYSWRWLYCTSCNKIKRYDEMTIFGGKDSINIGKCRDCIKTHK